MSERKSGICVTDKTSSIRENSTHNSQVAASASASAEGIYVKALEQSEGNILSSDNKSILPDCSSSLLPETMNSRQDILKSLNQSHHLEFESKETSNSSKNTWKEKQQANSFPTLYLETCTPTDWEEVAVDEEEEDTTSTSSPSDDGIFSDEVNSTSSSSTSSTINDHTSSPVRIDVLHRSLSKSLSSDGVKERNKLGSWTCCSGNLTNMDTASDREDMDDVYDFGSSRVASDEEDDVREDDNSDEMNYTDSGDKKIKIFADTLERRSRSRSSQGETSYSPSHLSLKDDQGLVITSTVPLIDDMLIKQTNPIQESSHSLLNSIDNYSQYINVNQNNEVLINGCPVDMSSQRYAVLTFEQVARLDGVMDSMMQIHGRGNFPTLEVKLKDLVQVVKTKLIGDGVVVRDIRLNGGAASYVLSSDERYHTYTDLDLIFGVELTNHRTFDKVRSAVLDSLVEFLPEGVNRKKMSSCTLKEAYVHKMVKVTEGGDRWSLISLCNNTGRDIEIKFVDTMKRQFEFSVDSFQIILDSLLLYYECSDSIGMTENIYPTVVGESVYGDFSQALTHLQRRIIATRNPEEIRGGGLLKYCRLQVLGYKPVKYDEIKNLEKYMCSRFFIDFSDIIVQRIKLANYLNTHFRDDQVKYSYLMILQKVVDESTVCLMGHERRQTLALIDEFASYFFNQITFSGEKNKIPLRISFNYSMLPLENQGHGRLMPSGDSLFFATKQHPQTSHLTLIADCDFYII